MRNFQDIFETCKRSFISAFSRCMTVPLTIYSSQYCTNIQKQPSRGVLRNRCSDNMQQSLRRTLMPKCDFNKVAKQLY